MEDRTLSSSKLPSLGLGPRGWRGEAPDPLDHPEFYQNVSGRRILAYLLDMVVVGVIFVVAWVAFSIVGVLSFGLLSTPLSLLLACVPLGYHTLLIGGPGSATWGMQLFRLEVRSFTGARPNFAQAGLMTVMFYATVWSTGFLILIVALFNDRRRTLHDLLSGTVVINSYPAAILVSDDSSEPPSYS